MGNSASAVFARLGGVTWRRRKAEGDKQGEEIELVTEDGFAEALRRERNSILLRDAIEHAMYRNDNWGGANRMPNTPTTTDTYFRLTVCPSAGAGNRAFCVPGSSPAPSGTPICVGCGRPLKRTRCKGDNE